MNKTLEARLLSPPVFFSLVSSQSKTFKWVKLISCFIRTWLPLHPAVYRCYKARRNPKSNIESLLESKSTIMKQPISLTHLKVSLGCLLEDKVKIGGKNLLGSRVLFRGAIGETPRELDWGFLATSLAFIYYSYYLYMIVLNLLILNA